MAKGKIVYIPYNFKALTFNETQYFSIDDSDFNFGTGDFCIDALLQVDSTVNDAESWIVAKGATVASLDGANGWHFVYAKATRTLKLRINDGDGSATLVASNASAFAFDTRFWARVTVDRDGLATVYVDGVSVGSGSVAAASGSINNTEYLKVGGYDTSIYRH